MAGEAERPRKKKLTLSLAHRDDLATDEAIEAWLDALGVPSADNPADVGKRQTAAQTGRKKGSRREG